MSTFMRRVHQFCIGFQAVSLVLYAYLYAIHPSSYVGMMMGWAAFFGAYSTRALMKARKGRGAGVTVVKCDRCFTMLPSGSIITRCPPCVAMDTLIGVEPRRIASLHGDATARKAAPMAEGLLWYFPDALAAVSHVSKVGNDQHNPGQPMHHARGKSSDHADCLMRHLALAGTFDKDGVRETAKVAWRALALLQEELEREEGVPLPRNARPDVDHAAAVEHVRRAMHYYATPPNYPRTDTGD